MQIPIKTSLLKSIVYFGPVDWDFRYQRPQQLTSQFSKRGWRTFYINPTIQFSTNPNPFVKSENQNGVEVCTLFWNNPSQYIGTSALKSEEGSLAARLIEDFLYWRKSYSNVIVVGQPGWFEVASRYVGNQIIFDCMDRHEGFAQIDTRINALEKELIGLADKVITSSIALQDYIGSVRQSSPTLIRNGADFDHFSQASSESKPLPVFGYFGAVAEWFDAQLIADLANLNPTVIFEIVGTVTSDEIKRILLSQPNITFLGEKAYDELPKLVERWHGALLPFLINDLTLATNPVKMYEYASAGLQIISTPMPEVVSAQKECSGIYVASSAEEFNNYINEIIQNNNGQKLALQKWARSNSWAQRAIDFENVIYDLERVSIIVLMWNNAALTIKCLASIVNNSDYSNLEVIVVDNHSIIMESELVQEWLRLNMPDQIGYRFVRNEQNLGFAAGNNVGLAQASGKYLVLLNNDTEVTPGWIWRSLKHFKQSKHAPIGLLGPSTDNCGNEARVVLQRGDSYWGQEVLTKFGHRALKSFQNSTLAFFCVMMPREVYEMVGGLDESYGRGYFEDDDYCRRVESAGFNIVIARDVFVHHEMGASFNKLPSEEQIAQFEKNKLIYEARWGKWVPHSYATDADQYL